MLNDVIFKVLTTTPVIGSTSVTFTDPLINNNSILEIYFTNDDFSYTDIRQYNHSVTIEYEELTTSIGIALFINNCDTFTPYDDTAISHMVELNTSNILLLNGQLNELNTKVDNLSSSDIPYDNTTSGLDADTVQDAIDILSNGSGGSATDIIYDNTTSGLDAENVQDAIDELSTHTTTEIYDGTERLIGTWFGKPLYTKTFNIRNLLINTYTDYALDIDDLDDVFISNAFFYRDSGNNIVSQILDHSDTTFNSVAFCQIVPNLKKLQIWIGSNLSPNTKGAYVTLKYTKVGD